MANSPTARSHQELPHLSKGILAHERHTKGSSSGCQAAVHAVTSEQVFWDHLSVLQRCVFQSVPAVQSLVHFQPAGGERLHSLL